MEMGERDPLLSVRHPHFGPNLSFTVIDSTAGDIDLYYVPVTDMGLIFILL